MSTYAFILEMVVGQAPVYVRAEVALLSVLEEHMEFNKMVTVDAKVLYSTPSAWHVPLYVQTSTKS